MPTSRRAAFNTLRTVTSASQTGSYIVFGTALPNGALLVKIVNNTNKDITISTDGTTDHDFIPAGAFALYDVGTNGQSSNNSERLCFPGNTQFWTKGTAGTGSLYLTSIYQTTS